MTKIWRTICERQCRSAPMSHSPSIGTPLVAKPADHNRASALIFWRIFETVNRVGAFYRYYLERSFRLHWVHFYNFICRNTIFTDNGSFLSYCIRAAIELILTPALLWLCDGDSLELIDFDRNRLYWTASDLSQSSDCHPQNWWDFESWVKSLKGYIWGDRRAMV